MKNPKVTVLLPVYNGQKYLKDAIQSILDQSYQDFEFLIINDASTDNSKGVIESFTDRRIRYVENKKNLNLLNTLNKGLRLAKGTYIARMDQDDISLLHRIARQVEFLGENPDIGVVGTGFQLIDQSGIKGSSIRFPQSPHFIRWSLCFYNPLAHPTVMFRKDPILKIGGYSSLDMGKRGRYPSEDYELWRRASKITKLSNMPEVLLYLRKHESNLTNFDQHLIDARKISSLAISDVLGKAVPQETVDLMWLKNFKKPTDIEKVADLIFKLYQHYRQKNKMTPQEGQAIRLDAVKRLVDLALRPQARSVQNRVFNQAYTIDIWSSLKLIPMIKVRNFLYRKGSL